MSVADSKANLAAYSKQAAAPNGGSSYPSLRLLALVSCGTRTVIDAVFGPVIQRRDHLRRGPAAGEPARRDAPARRPELRLRAAGRGRSPRPEADFLIRVQHRVRRPQAPRPAAPARRVVAVALRRRPGPGHRRRQDRRHQRRAAPPASCRLVTTLTDPARYPASDLAVLYHERWEIETAYLELKSTILGGRVLRARTPDGIEQEIYALLVTYQALRTAIADAAATAPGTDPDRASFTIALNAARDQVILAAGVIAGTGIDLAGQIGRTRPGQPHARPGGCATSPRIVKRAMSRYNARGKVDRTRPAQATIDIVILTAPLTGSDDR